MRSSSKISLLRKRLWIFYSSSLLKPTLKSQCQKLSCLKEADRNSEDWDELKSVSLYHMGSSHFVPVDCCCVKGWRSIAWFSRFSKGIRNVGSLSFQRLENTFIKVLILCRSNGMPSRDIRLLLKATAGAFKGGWCC